MIDIHCHILPGVDDGPQLENQFVKMAGDAVRNGITDVIATPHHFNGKYENKKYDIIERVSWANRKLEEEKLPLTIHPGQELRIHREIFFSIQLDEVMTYGHQGKYLLLELPANEIPDYCDEIIYELQIEGIVPIIAHPERNKVFWEEPDRLYDLVEAGALAQITAGSILGHFGRKVKNHSGRLIEHDLIHFVASDAHNLSSRGFYLQEAYIALRRKFGKEIVEFFQGNAMRLLRGEEIDRRKPKLLRRKKLGIF